MKYFLDTNTAIYFFKGMGNVNQHFFACKTSDIAIPAIVLYELQVGILKSTHPQKRTQQLTHLLSQVTVVDFGKKEALATAQIRADLETKGTPIGEYDLQIAGTTLANKATLITHNTREFSRVVDLKLTDWF